MDVPQPTITGDHLWLAFRSLKAEVVPTDLLTFPWKVEQSILMPDALA